MRVLKFARISIGMSANLNLHVHVPVRVRVRETILRVGLRVGL